MANDNDKKPEEIQAEEQVPEENSEEVVEEPVSSKPDESPKEELSPEELKAKIAELNEKKETAFQKKQEVGHKIADKIRSISDYKKQRNTLTKKVREMKKDRDKLNTQITEKISEIKAMKPKKKKEIEIPKDEKGRPIRSQNLQRQIKAMEQKIETVPMNFDAEKKTMRLIKQMQKQLGQIEAATGMSGEMLAKSKEIDALKKEANQLHAQVTVIAKQSQEYHEKMLDLGKEIDELKKQEDTLYQEFLDHKQQYVSLAGDAQVVKEEERKERQAKKEAARKAARKKEAQDKKTLKQRAKEAEEKMTTGKKLTTEDLLALQGLKD